MKLFGNDSNRPRVGRNTADFEPVSAAKAEKARSQARKKADKARSEARREYTEQRTYAEVKAEAKARREREKSAQVEALRQIRDNPKATPEARLEAVKLLLEMENKGYI